MKILVLNSGSSSIKFKLFDDTHVKASGLVEKIGESQSKVVLNNALNNEKFQRECPVKNHEEGLQIVNELFKESGILADLNALDGCGHRVVHGGKNLNAHCLVDDYVLEEIDRVSIFAPLHNRAHLAGIKTLIKAAPNVRNVAVFDTAFHRSMPDFAYMYALPYELYEKHSIRKYGFHGTSHAFVSSKAANLLQKDKNDFNAISAHLGNGASVCAIEKGHSVDTSMGFTPLEGLIMGTRCGDLDPAILPFISHFEGLSIEQIDTLLNKKSGVYGICAYNDFRDIQDQMQKGNDKARLALDMFCYRLVKYIGAYFAVLPKTDVLIFTGGIGENDTLVRQKVCERLSHLGIVLDHELNKEKSSAARMINSNSSKVKILVVPTDEELEIARITQELVSKTL
ncbi:acetate kinase [Campylobacter sp. VicNov18]|uniref:acetate kinase n=1 Tax=Campylobacter bilis TaxID=2691918 RepID=UPI00130ED2E9|nr:acetate kinase [Campylobacter bilis]MPV63471.1 acetate/propionate family kinase [Campylobacter hepaticus]MBM0636970.1 acetate/propionate family kinase [Campylobacter bilis]MCC8277682.1 acetate kinase [Campylobacter bilis]MCC8299291.1 acetate kinase [Campylobacter bilis]MCC8300591.1 acetate kinase [Campylobacter bilis]